MIPGDKAVYPGTSVLVNRHDVRDFAAARALEYKFTTAREIQLRGTQYSGDFNFARVQEIHKHLFQDMYSWAGQLREVDFAKPHKETGQVNQFTMSVLIETKAKEFDNLIADKNQLKGLNRGEFVSALTEVHTKLDEIHPFREGNGRSAKIFIAELARNAGYEIDLSKIPRDAWTMASHKAAPHYDPRTNTPQQPDLTIKRELFDHSIKPTLSHAFQTESRERAVGLYPALQIVYDRLDAIQRIAERMPNAEAGTRLIATERARLAEKLSTGAGPETLASPYLVGRNGHAPSAAASMTDTAARSAVIEPTMQNASAARSIKM